jgi:hypothetical protein
MSKDEIVEVTAADRQAASAIYGFIRRELDDRAYQIAAAHRLSATPPSPPAMGEVERLKAENEELRERGAQAIIAYHVAICSPKGVVPDDSFYDPAIANHCERELSAGAQKAVDLLALTTRRCLASLTVPETVNCV